MNISAAGTAQKRNADGSPTGASWNSKRGGADGHQIEEALVDLDREGRALEMAAHTIGHTSR